MKAEAQKAALGKATWHTFTDVVLLRENMRQRGLSPEDCAFRTALRNMRYACCTDDDIRLLRTRIYHPHGGTPVTSLSGFEDVPIITPRNAHRDAINEQGALRFAASRHRKLHYFHAVDSWANVHNWDSIRRAQREYDRIVDPVRKANRIPPRLQDALWKLRPALTNNHAGILTICEDMPVLLKMNEATELCATNGAPGIVVGWDAHSDNQGREILDVLFVRLTQTKEDVHIEGLPPNVVPIGRNCRTIKCTLPIGDLQVSIRRQQVACLPHFAVTDFGCQGQTWNKSIAHTTHCRTHQSLYTVFSRCTSLHDTIILDGFDATKIQRGPAPALLQEFYELELLDEITRLREDGKLPPSVRGTTRGELLTSFLAAQTEDYVPPHADSALDWTYFPRGIQSKQVRAGKRRAHDGPPSAPLVHKRLKRTETWIPSNLALPQSRPDPDDSLRQGLRWDATDWSCAYDSLFTILWNIRIDEGDAWFNSLPQDNILCRAMVTRFVSLPTSTTLLESTRDNIRDAISMMDPDTFPRRGPATASVSELITALFQCPTAFGTSSVSCTVCGTVSERATEIASSFLWCVLPFHVPEMADVQSACLNLLHHSYDVHCHACRSLSGLSTQLNSAPPLLVLEVANVNQLDPNTSLSLPVAGQLREWALRGVIYHGRNHFTARYLSADAHVWYHDGASTGQYCNAEGPRTRSLNLLVADQRQASHYIYALRPPP
ncbi:hypothetical protein OH77DRAFT_1464029 [Trametes cingulata]|nr:hypothetical protein OH77DRAFT_1465307 [Trametes cingulata]KAI0350317.1 hypothetical protein OH77DRAFT_1464029 [Trametes cingulata]